MSRLAASSVLHLKSIDSTQTLARALAERGAGHGTMIRADRQTGGRGRMEKKWDSRLGGLYFSLILRPAFDPRWLAEFNLKAARSVAEALAHHAGVQTMLKAPNDVLARDRDGKFRKICGVLAEASGSGNKLDWLVLGIGVNVNNDPRLKTATSLKRSTAKTWDIERVLQAVLRRLEIP